MGGQRGGNSLQTNVGGQVFKVSVGVYSLVARIGRMAASGCQLGGQLDGPTR